MDKSLKPLVIQACLAILNDRLAELNETEKSAKESAAGDTKSSAGDKHETSRELLQQERDMAGRRMQEASRQKDELERILPESTFHQVQSGALAETSAGIFFFSTALGFVTVNRVKIAVLSMASPIGQAMKGKNAGENVDFQGRKITIEEII